MCVCVYVTLVQIYIYNKYILCCQRSHFISIVPFGCTKFLCEYKYSKYSLSTSYTHDSNHCERFAIENWITETCVNRCRARDVSKRVNHVWANRLKGKIAQHAYIEISTSGVLICVAYVLDAMRLRLEPRGNHFVDKRRSVSVGAAFVCFATRFLR